MLSRVLSLFLALLFSGAALAEPKKIGFLAQPSDWDETIRSQSQTLVTSLSQAGFEVVYVEALYLPEILSKTRELVYHDRVDALLLRTYVSLPPQLFSDVNIDIPVVSFNTPIELPHAVYIGYNPVEIGKAQIGFLAE